MTKLTPLPVDCAPWVAELKTRIATTQLRATGQQAADRLIWFHKNVLLNFIVS